MSIQSLIFAWLLCGAAAAVDNGTTCAGVREVFVMKDIGPAHLVQDAWTKGDDLEICPSSQTCCSSAMEEKYGIAGKKDLKLMIQGTGSYLKTLISSSASKFRDSFLEMIQVSENSTIALFVDVYKSFEGQARVPLNQLYADLLAYMSGKEVDLEERANSFFDVMFPIVFRHAINYKQPDFSDIYKECLRDATPAIRPFGDLSGKIATQVSRSFEAARTFLEALQLGIEVINTTEHMDFGPECRAAVVRLTYCAQCQGFIHTKPCKGMCLNVIRGCLSSVSELDDSWSEYVSGLERLTSGMVGVYNMEHVSSTLDTRISEIVSYFLTNSAEIIQRAKTQCGGPRPVSREKRQLKTSASYHHFVRYSARPVYETSMYILLQNFVHKLAESKEFYANLADRVCTDGNLIIKGDLHCWNGTDIGEYTKTVSGIGVLAQRYNAEMKGPKERDVTINTLIDKLKHMRQILTSRVTSVPQSDSSVIGEGSGSGAWWQGSDDEDYAGASGSGDFQKEDKSDIHFASGSPDPKSSSAHTVEVPLLLVILCTWFLLRRK